MSERDNMSRWSRRHALKVLAAALTVPLGAAAISRVGGQAEFQTWRGESLGGAASLTLWHPNAAFARSIITRMRSEVERLERVFSLFRHDSEIARLNRDGQVLDPTPDLVTVLGAAREVAAASGGAFDPTVQPLWRLHSEHFRRQPAASAGPPAAAIEAARALVDYRQLDLAPRQVRFGKPGMSVTLNGIAQGYITDRIADLLQQEGFDNSMVQVGETRALGGQPLGGAWPIGIKSPRNPTAIDRTIAITNEALAVSGGYGQHFVGSDLHHIFDPTTGRSANKVLDVAVIAPRAMLADALSTAIFVSGKSEGEQLLERYPEARATVTSIEPSA